MKIRPDTRTAYTTSVFWIIRKAGRSKVPDNIAIRYTTVEHYVIPTCLTPWLAPGATGLDMQLLTPFLQHRKNTFKYRYNQQWGKDKKMDRGEGG